MLELRSFRTRVIALTLAGGTLLVGIPVTVHHHADHADEAVHLEHPHGGHGGILEQDDARMPAPLGQAILGTRAYRLPDACPIRTERAVPKTFAQPPGRAPPPDLPRGPPTHS